MVRLLPERDVRGAEELGGELQHRRGDLLLARDASRDPDVLVEECESEGAREGAGDAVKAVNNALLALHLWSTAEGLAALTQAGVRPEVALDVINTSSGRSNASMNLFPERVLTRAFPRTFRLALLDKDVGIAAGVAREQQIASPMLQLTAELFRAAHVALGEDADHVEVVKWVERLTGTVIE